MVSSSSTKKAARLAQKGKGKKVRFQGGTLFPMLVLAILVIGLGRHRLRPRHRPAADASPPTIDDHWHVAYGFYAVRHRGFVQLNGALEETDANGQLVNNDFLRTGVHSHDDGVIHWHAYTSAATGKQRHARRVPGQLRRRADDDSLKFPENQNGGKEYIEGETKCRTARTASCPSPCGRARRTPATAAATSSGFDDIRIDQNSMVFTIAFQPRGTDDRDARRGRRPGGARRRRHGETEPPASVPASSTPWGHAATVAATPDGRLDADGDRRPDADDGCRPTTTGG